MLLKEFREQFLELLLTFLWRQWSILGVLGESASEEDWIIDPEALLIFSLEIARYEPRLFDEILSWLEINGYWLDTARLKRIIQKQDESIIRIIGGSLQYILSRGDKRKWQNMVKLCGSLYERQPGVDWFEILFKEKSGKEHPPSINNCDPDFSLFYINRPQANIRKKAREVPINAYTNISITS